MSAATSAAPSLVLRQRWNGLAPRERVLVAVMGAALVVLVVWLVAVRPAWTAVSQGPLRRAQADVDLQRMTAIANEAKADRALPPVGPAQAEQVLKSATDRLGAKGKLALQPDRATLTLAGATGADLLQWLTEARGGAHVRPIETNLTRAGDGYNGTLVVSLGSGAR